MGFNVAHLDPKLSMALVVLALATLAAMVMVAWHECVSFRVGPDALRAAWFGAGTLILLVSPPDILIEALATGCIAAALTDAVRCWKPMAVGQGDIWMMGLIGFIAGPDHVVAALFTFGVVCVLTAVGYSLVRSRPLFHVVFPVALPGMGVAALALVLRLNDVTGWLALPEEYDQLRQAAYQVPPVLVLVAMLWAIGLGFIALNRRRVGIWTMRAAP